MVSTANILRACGYRRTREGSDVRAPSTWIATKVVPAHITGTSDEKPKRQNASGAAALMAIERSAFGGRLLVALTIIAALWWAQVVLIPIVLSVLIAYALEPLVARLESCRLPRPVAVPVLLATLLAICGGGAYGLRGEAAAFLDRLPAGAHIGALAIHGATR